MDDPLLTTDEVASLLRVHPKQVYRLLKRGLPARRVGNEWRFLRGEVLAWSGAPPAARPDVASRPVPGALPPPLLAANGDVAVEILLDLANAGGGPLVGFVRADRDGGLAMLRDGAVLLAGCHGAGFPARLGDDRLTRVHLVTREIGLAVRSGEVPPMRDLHRWRFAGRPRTAGVTVHVEAALKAARARAPSGSVLASHRDVALALLSGEADVGVLTAAWAARLGLPFRAFASEAYGLVLRAGDLGHPVAVRLCEVAQGAEWRRRVEGLAGYDLADAGAIRYDPA